MKLYDLTHLLNNESPVYPGIPAPRFTPSATIDENRYRETKFQFHSHLGTHIDAPAHMLQNGLSLDQMKIESFRGNALVICISVNEKRITKKTIQNFEKELPNIDFVLFKTGWSRFWGNEKYFDEFPVLDSYALEYLLSFKLKGIGFDTISADPMNSADYKNHFSIFEKGMLIIENLVFPHGFNETIGDFSCFPLYYKNADGSPVRAIFQTI